MKQIIKLFDDNDVIILAVAALALIILSIADARTGEKVHRLIKKDWSSSINGATNTAKFWLRTALFSFWILAETLMFRIPEAHEGIIYVELWSLYFAWLLLRKDYISFRANLMLLSPTEKLPELPEDSRILQEFLGKGGKLK